jgi:hypothetical protein
VACLTCLLHSRNAPGSTEIYRAFSLSFFLFPFYVEALPHVMKHEIQYEIYGLVDSGSVLSDLASFLLRKRRMEASKEGRKEVLRDRLTETFIQSLRVLWTSKASYSVIQT